MSILRNAEVPPNLDVIHESAEILGVKFGPAKKADKLVTKMRDYFSGKLSEIPKEEWIVCPVCGEVTDDDNRIVKCPFCGDEGEDEDSPDTPPGNGSEAAAKPAEEEQEPEPIDGADFDDSPDPVEATPVNIHDDEELEPPEPEPDPAIEIEKSEVKVAKKRGVKTEESAAIIPSEEANDEIIPEEQLAEMKVELDKEKAIIKASQNKSIDSHYDIGLSLRKIYRGNLWKAEGVKSWRAFCEKVEVSHTFAYNLMKLVGEFDRQTFLEVGRKKLQIIARLENDEDKKELLKDAKSGASTTELEQKKKEKEGKVKETKEGKQADDKGEAGRKNKEEQKITLLAKVGGRPKMYTFRDRKDHTEVETWKKDAYIELPISDTVHQYIVLKTDDNGAIIGATVAFRKVDATGK